MNKQELITKIAELKKQRKATLGSPFKLGAAAINTRLTKSIEKYEEQLNNYKHNTKSIG
mgnify:FL=1